MASAYCNISCSIERDDEENLFPMLKRHCKKLPKLFRKRSKKDDSASESEDGTSNKTLPHYLRYTHEDTPYDEYLHGATFRLDRIHGEAHLIIQLQDCGLALCQYRLLQDYVPPNQQQPRRQDLEEILSQPRISWKELHAHLDRELAEEWRAKCNERKPDDLPWLSVVRRVAKNMRSMPDWHLIREIGEHVRRLDAGVDNGIKELAGMADAWSLGRKIRKDIEHDMNYAFPESDQEEERSKIQRGINREKEKCFEVLKDAYRCGKFKLCDEYLRERRGIISQT
ncbi:hypothetical protein SLS57_002448 [Botryosphaeria dothidea]